MTPDPLIAEIVACAEAHGIDSAPIVMVLVWDGHVDELPDAEEDPETPRPFLVHLYPH